MGIGAAAPVGEDDPALPARRHVREALLLDRADRGVAGIAQHIDVEARGITGCHDTIEHGVEIADHAVRQFVADAQQQGGGGGDRLVAADARGWRVHRPERVACKPHEQEPDDGIPETDHRPGQRDREEKNEQKIKKSETAGREHVNRGPQQGGHCQQHENGKQRAPLQHGKAARRTGRAGQRLRHFEKTPGLRRS